MNTKVVVPWHNFEQLDRFLKAWSICQDDDRVIFQQDRHHEGCACTKNRGIEAAMQAGSEIVIVLDDDCFPDQNQEFAEFIEAHERALEPQPVNMFQVVTNPPSRGTPYYNRTITMPVAASMGFWRGIGDYDAPSQLVHGAMNPMEFRQEPIHGRYFPLCGMNLAFRVTEWPWCRFINVPRFDDIWHGFLWQRKAFADGKCFNLAGPIVNHSRQSNVWANLKDEVMNLERNETIWQEIHAIELGEYDQMVDALTLR